MVRHSLQRGDDGIDVGRDLSGGAAKVLVVDGRADDDDVRRGGDGIRDGTGLVVRVVTVGDAVACSADSAVPVVADSDRVREPGEPGAQLVARVVGGTLRQRFTENEKPWPTFGSGRDSSACLSPNLADRGARDHYSNPVQTGVTRTKVDLHRVRPR